MLILLLQAFECKMIRIRPSPVMCPDGKWTDEANQVFRDLVMNIKLVARVS